ncbi:MAG: type II toxin-antitoxin system VapC family toxin [Candidatus Altiarchaeota archaeon]|nr:type II toxin-antitoxin system VapC family toxin [Candidatus Altiarchaeota archaeon]
MIYVDSNIFIVAVLDKTARGNISRKCLGLVDHGKTDAITSSLTMDELMWTLIKHGKKHLVTEVVHSIYESRLMVVPVSSQAPLKACEFLERFELSPRDAIHAAVIKENNLNDILSEDRHFDNVSWLKRYSPKSFIEVFGGTSH